MHRPPYIFFHFHSNNPLRASSSSEEKAISKRTVLLRVSQQGIGSSFSGAAEEGWTPNSSAPVENAKGSVWGGGGWMTSSLSSVLHICSERAWLESLMPVVLAGRPSEGSRRAELRVGEARRLSFDGSRQRPAAAQRAPLLDARLRPELRLAQLQQ